MVTALIVAFPDNANILSELERKLGIPLVADRANGLDYA
jgi:hypothetical protein